MSQMQGRVCVITGGTAGIGRATALALAKLGATVVILGRSRERGQQARAEIANESGNDKIEFVVADLAVHADVRRAAAELLQKHAKIHVLINNAAVLLPRREVTVDGIEKMFATNYLSHFLLTKGKYSSFGALRPSKLALILFTRELAKRLAGTGVTANALEPGLARTTMMDDHPWLIRTLIHLISTTPEKGAQTSVFLASDPAIATVTGKYFAKGREAPMRGAQVDDEGLWKQLWDRSAQLCKLT